MMKIDNANIGFEDWTRYEGTTQWEWGFSHFDPQKGNVSLADLQDQATAKVYPDDSGIWRMYLQARFGGKPTWQRYRIAAGVGLPVSSVARPIGDESRLGTWTSEPTGTTLWDKVAEDPYNDSNYIQCSGLVGGRGRAMFNLTPLAIPAGATVNSVTINFRASKASGGTSNAATALKVGGNYYDSAGRNTTLGFEPYSDAWTINPKTGAPWTAADLNGTSGNALQAAGHSTNTTAPQSRFSWAELVVNYTGGETTTEERLLVFGQDVKAVKIEPLGLDWVKNAIAVNYALAEDGTYTKRAWVCGNQSDSGYGRRLPLIEAMSAASIGTPPTGYGIQRMEIDAWAVRDEATACGLLSYLISRYAMPPSRVTFNMRHLAEDMKIGQILGCDYVSFNAHMLFGGESWFEKWFQIETVTAQGNDYTVETLQAPLLNVDKVSMVPRRVLVKH
jgi:hypothetical protein